MSLEYYKKVIINSNIDDSKKNEFIESVSKVSKKGLPIILNTFHLSNVLGYKWKALKDILNDIDSMYHSFYIKKKSGGYRQISAPNEMLKTLQLLIKERILDNITISESSYGFVKEKSIIDNAKKHLNAEVVLNVDIKDFFPSINKNRVYYVFNRVCGYTKEVSFFLTKIVTYRGSLPQGAPTSPILSNIIAYTLDSRLEGLAKSKNIIYTRYADDITFSGKKDYINYSLLYCVNQIIKDCGFKLNKNKTRFANKSKRQEVTGLVVNNSIVNVPKSYIRELRKELYYVSKYGIKNHREKVGFENLYYKDHLLGKILYVKSINSNIGDKFLNIFNTISFE